MKSLEYACLTQELLHPERTGFYSEGGFLGKRYLEESTNKQ